MARVIRATWEPTQDFGLPRKARGGCDYEAYAPDFLADREFLFDDVTVADISSAERALQTLDSSPAGLADSEAIARLLLRAEAVASSKIEGLAVGGRRLLQAQLLSDLGQTPIDRTATEILGNIDAMGWAVDTVAEAPSVRVEDLLEVHRRLLLGTTLEHLGGVVRTTQNWIGGSSYNPCTAAFVPPPPQQVEALLSDLCAFCSREDLSPVVQAAIAHAQFETIHPFADGNGRTGRALIHVVLRRRGLTRRVLAPISLILATWSQDYVAGLTATRYRGEATSDEAVTGTNAWVSLFASAAERSAADGLQYQRWTAEIQNEWRSAVGRVRADSAVLRLIEALPGSPVITVQTAAALIDRSVPSTNAAVNRLVEVGVLTPTTVARRNRAFEARALIDAFTSLERQLASPEADTNHSPPARAVPRRV